MTEFITEFVSFCLQILFWTVVVQLVLRFLVRINQISQAEEDDLVKRVKDIIHQVQVETHNNVHYWFDADDGSFLAQGDTEESVVEQLRQRFPQHIFLLTQKDTIYKVSAPDWTVTPIIEIQR